MSPFGSRGLRAVSGNLEESFFFEMTGSSVVFEALSIFKVFSGNGTINGSVADAVTYELVNDEAVDGDDDDDGLDGVVETM